jgi:putative transposase
LQAIIRNVGCEWGKNIPGCPEKKPHVERFNREMNSFLHTLPGSSFSDELPNKERIEKGMLEATYTLDELRVLLARWVYDVYVKKVRRAIHSPMRQAKSPLQSWKQLECEMLLPAAPEDIREMFMVEKTVRKVQHYGIEVLGVHFHSNALRDLIQRIGRKTSVEVRYDPSDIREIAVLDPETGLHFPVAAKSEDVLAVSYADAKKLREPSKDAMCADASARATAAQIAINAQKLAESRGRGSIKSIRSARAQERVRQKEREILDSSKRVPGAVCSDIEKANQPTPKLTVRRPTQLPVLDQME